MDGSGNLYGGTGNGVFELARSGNQWVETVLYTAQTYFGLALDSAGNLYGAALGGYNGYVFELSLSRPGYSGQQLPSQHLQRKGGKDGSLPQGTVILDSSGNLYGTTGSGGCLQQRNLLPSGAQTIWLALRPFLHSFRNSKKDGFIQTANSYSTPTAISMARPCTAVRIIPYSCKSILNSLDRKSLDWSFSSGNGANPASGVVVDKLGNLYGTTAWGGSAGHGVAFEVTPEVAL